VRRWAAAAPAAAALLAACAAAPRASRPAPFPLATTEQHDEPEIAGVLHVVRRGETLYRIARAYGIDPADLMETNGISDPRSLSVGAELFVPGAERVLELPAPPNSPGGGTAAEPAPVAPAGGTPRPGAAQVATPAPVPAAEQGRAASLAWPLRGVLYGRYGVRQGHRHDGIDISAPEGTAVAAAARGKVIYVGEQSGYGNLVIIRHEDGLVTLYAHASKILVEEGDTVERGTPIARVGQTGRTTGPHLHFEVRVGTRPRNPLLYLP